jgi:acyl-CoA synthetase (AMP-forming)/AMP-acid ligase II
VALYVGEATKKDIFTELKAKLPKYMIPNVFMQRDALPLNKNGKIDRQMLRRYYEENK